MRSSATATWPGSGGCSRRRRPRSGPGYQRLYRLFQGPIATNLENRREPFLAVLDAPPGKNVYPADLTQAEMDAFLAAHPDERARLIEPAVGRAPGRRGQPRRRPRDAPGDIRCSTRFIPAFAPGWSSWHGGRTGGALRGALFDGLCPRDAAGARPAQRGGRPCWTPATRNSPAISATAPATCSPTITKSGDAAWVTGRFQQSQRPDRRLRDL